MLEEKIELFVITYNRAKYLERTLTQLLSSPFARCRITILDNCSTDATPEVCRSFAARFAQLRVVRHRKNIGASPNYLRAVEMSESPYTWVLGDDDTYDFSDCADVLEAFESERFDLISLGSPEQPNNERGLTTTSRELIEQDTRYFSFFTFLTGVAFRTELFDSACFFQGYRNAINLYPHFEFICKSAENNFSVYTSKTKIVERTFENDGHLNYIPWLTAWVHSCELITDRRLRRKAIRDFSPRTLHPMVIFHGIGREKANGHTINWREIISMWFIMVGEQKLLWFLYLPLFMLPAFAFRGTRALERLRCRLVYGTVPEERQAADHFRL